METASRGLAKSIGRVVCAGAIVVAGAGCQHMAHHPMGEGRYDGKGSAAGPVTGPAQAIGALAFGDDGEVFVVDADGKRVPACVMPGTRDPVPECHGLEDTKVMSIQSIAFIRHTGSTCVTLGPIINAGKAYYFQLPIGCKR